MNTLAGNFDKIQTDIWKLATDLKEENIKLCAENEILRKLVDGWVKRFEELIEKPKQDISGILENKIITVKLPVPAQSSHSQPSQPSQSSQPSQLSQLSQPSQPSQPIKQSEKTPEQIKKEKQREAVRKCREKKRLAKEKK